jgi:hypothetical protein
MQIVRSLRQCRKHTPNNCDESVVGLAAARYWRGDAFLLPLLLDVARNSDGALSEGLGDFFSALLCKKTNVFLNEVAKRPRNQWRKLTFLATTADGGGMGCGNLNGLRKKLTVIARRGATREALLARECLAQINKYNATR